MGRSPGTAGVCLEIGVKKTMSDIGAEVGFEFTLERYQHGRGQWFETKRGRGIVLRNDDYSVWPAPGYTLRVTSSPDYPEGTTVHVSSSSVRR